ncbi:ABC transporter substrate-binding protein [Janibacter alkaliphilus]|uniref:Peptide/nickel transport system substrate-binding protein n=1 Tax=Janibacter alkaliphilus TaxID=1069963 RepID=A0A852XFG8_9MICO|nr:ABC transporter substrate-binding protein [Janibacter alkaliphilus]NYG37285.1 peptide/nickel transport system substrate-binding protein [Janibacter alkaliphilus]
MTGTPTRSRRARLAALAATAGVVLAGCTGGDDQAEETSTPEGPEGELTLLAQGPVDAWDPQRIVDRRTAGVASRLWMRTLTAYPPAEDAAGQRELTGDLATDTGTPNEDLTEWSFTLREGLTWQDGSPITCGDVRYGVSRAFAEDTGSGGYAVTYLDIPKRADGTSTYPGPYGSEGRSSDARKLIADAVECDGQTVTFNLGEPVATFDEIVSVPEFAPYEEAQDEQGDSAHLAFSSGPYMLEEDWTPSDGGTWVRNPEWSEGDDPLREAGPREIVHREGLEPEDALAALAEDDGTRSLMLDPLPPALADQREQLGQDARSVTGDGQLVEYLAPNMESDAFAKQDVRRAFALSTDRRGYVEALGGRDAGGAAWSLLPEILPSAHDAVMDAGPGGDPERAQELLTEAEEDEPVAVTVAYRSDTEGMDEAMQALADGWEAGGFEVTLEPVETDYYEQVGARRTADERDVVWANWGHDYPSAATVLPPLFDNRVNLTSTSLGRNYGQVADTELNEAMDEAGETRGDSARAEAWTEVDTELLRDGAYVPLRQTQVTYVAGSEVTGLGINAAYGGVPDLGSVGVRR